MTVSITAGGAGTRMKNLVNLLSDEDLIAHMGASFLRPRGAFLNKQATLVANQTLAAGDEVEVFRLWGNEASPEARVVREKLCSLQVPYIALVVDPGDDTALRLEHGGNVFAIATGNGLREALGHLDTQFSN